MIRLRLQWSQLNLLLKIATVEGLIGGGLVLIFGLVSLAVAAVSGLQVSFGFDLLPLLVFVGVFPLLSLLCALELLLTPVSEERKGVLGFIALFGSVVPNGLLLILLLRLIFPYRDTPTGL